jgi:hypothetical protein
LVTPNRWMVVISPAPFGAREAYPMERSCHEQVPEVNIEDQPFSTRQIGHLDVFRWLGASIDQFFEIPLRLHLFP